MLTGEMLLAIVVLFGVILLARSWRLAEARAARAAEENETLLAERDRLRTDLVKETKSRKRLAEELATHRNKTDKANRRKSKAVEQPLGTTTRIRDHEARVAQAERERDRMLAERDALTREVSRLQAELAEHVRVVEPTPPPAPVESEDSSALARARADLSFSRESVTKLAAELAEARQAEGRLRKRMDIQEQLYASLRSELEVKKDRLRTQEEQLLRFQSLEAALRDGA